MRLLCLLVAVRACGQTPNPTPPKDPVENKHDRILWIIPNYKTAPDVSGPIEPLGTKEKFHLAAEDTLDPYSFALAGMYAGIGQWQNQYPAFGQGASGYAKRFGGAIADLAIGNYLTEAVMPTVLHEDPRYFRLAKGGFWKRTGYALGRIVITRTDSGGRSFNYSEISGNAAAAAISNVYYPAANRTPGAALQKFGIQLATDAGFNVLKEFWPDMRRKIFKR